MTQAKWLPEPAAAERLGIKPVTLRAMRREGRLTPGRDWRRVQSDQADGTSL